MVILYLPAEFGEVVANGAEAHGKSFRISARNGPGALTEYYCHPEGLGYTKLKELLTKAKLATAC